MNLGGEARHRQTSDEESYDDELPLLDDKEWKHNHKKKGESFMESSTKLLAAAFLFSLAVFLMLSTLFNRKVVLESTLLRQYGRLKLTIPETDHAKPAPGSDDGVLDWLNSSDEIKHLRANNQGMLRVGILDFTRPNVIKWKALAGGLRPTVFSSSRSSKKSFTWSDYFPQHIDRNEEVQNARCPEMTLPSVPLNLVLDLLVVNIPCDADQYINSTRDIGSIRASLSAAHIAARTGAMHVAVVTRCRLDPTVFKCKYLAQQQDNRFWLYKLDLNPVKDLLRLPVGSCKAVPVPEFSGDIDHEHSYNTSISRQAYATILHSVKSYSCGAVILAHSIRKSGSSRDMILLVDEHVSAEDEEGLEAAGWKIQRIERIRNPRAMPLSYNEWNYSKFRLWQLTQYDKVVFIDADVVVGRSMDFLFELPEMSAAMNHMDVFNSGVMVVEPSQCTYERLVEGIGRVESYNGGDQGYLNEVFTYWHRLPRSVNFLKHFDDDAEENERKVAVLTSEPAAVHGLHFLGMKPWQCGREFDCNKDLEFANAAVHRKWWQIHDTMPRRLQKFCTSNVKGA